MLWRGDWRPETARRCLLTSLRSQHSTGDHYTMQLRTTQRTMVKLKA